MPDTAGEAGAELTPDGPCPSAIQCALLSSMANTKQGACAPAPSFSMADLMQELCREGGRVNTRAAAAALENSPAPLDAQSPTLEAGEAKIQPELTLDSPRPSAPLAIQRAPALQTMQDLRFECGACTPALSFSMADTMPAAAAPENSSAPLDSQSLTLEAGEAKVQLELTLDSPRPSAPLAIQRAPALQSSMADIMQALCRVGGASALAPAFSMADFMQDVRREGGRVNTRAAAAAPKNSLAPLDSQSLTRAPALQSSMADIMNDLCGGRVVGGQAFPAARAPPNPVRPPRLSALAAVRSQSSDDPRMYEAKWLSRTSTYEELQVLGKRSESTPSRRALSLDSYYSLHLDDVNDVMAELSKGTLDDLLRAPPMPYRPKFVSVPNGGTVPVRTCGGRRMPGSRSLP